MEEGIASCRIAPPQQQPSPTEWVHLVPRVARVVRHHVWSADLDELVSDGLVGLVVACRVYRGEGSPGPFLAQRVKWAMLDGHRARHGRWTDGRRPFRDRVTRTTEVPHSWVAPDEPPEQAALRQVMIDDVRAAVHALPPDARRLAWAYAYEGGPTRLAEAEGVTQAAITHRKAWLRRLLAPLRGWVVDND